MLTLKNNPKNLNESIFCEKSGNKLDKKHIYYIQYNTYVYPDYRFQ